MEDASANKAFFAAQRHEAQPNSRYQFDNIVSQSVSGLGGDHLFKGGVQFGRLSYESDYDVRTTSTCSTTTACRPRCASGTRRPSRRTVDKMLGFFVQDAWSVGRKLTLNLGLRFDHNAGTLPDAVRPAAARSSDRSRSPRRRRQPEPRSCGAPACPTIRSATARPRSRPATAATGCRSASIASPTSTRSRPPAQTARGPIRTRTASRSRARSAPGAAASRVCRCSTRAPTARAGRIRTKSPPASNAS